MRNKFNKRFLTLLLSMVMLTMFTLSNVSCIFAASNGGSVSVYFMAKGFDEDNVSSSAIVYECRKLIVPEGATVSDVTYAIENGKDSVTTGSGLAWYTELFGQANGAINPSSGWMYYVNDYTPVWDLSNERTVEDGMFIIWEYVSEYDSSWNAIINDPIDFAAEKANADSKRAIRLDNTVEVYFMARGVDADAVTTPVVVVEPTRLVVSKGVSVSDVTKAVEGNEDNVTSGSGLSWYTELFGQANGAINPSSGWMYYVDDYTPVWDLSNERAVEDGMFIIWEYVSEYDDSWNAIIKNPVDFEAMRSVADKKIATSLATGALRGDTDGDGIVTANDAAVVLQNVLSSGSLKMNEAVADFDRDGILTANDASLILSRVLGAN